MVTHGSERCLINMEQYRNIDQINLPRTWSEHPLPLELISKILFLTQDWFVTEKWTDIDECAEEETVCGHGEYCVNTEGSYECRCPADNPECTSDHLPQSSADTTPPLHAPHCKHPELPNTFFTTGQNWTYKCQTCECLVRSHPTWLSQFCSTLPYLTLPVPSKPKNSNEIARYALRLCSWKWLMNDTFLVFFGQNGEPDCWPQECPPVYCANSHIPPGDCCPRCLDDPCGPDRGNSIQRDSESVLGCHHNSNNYTIQPEWCTTCECKVPFSLLPFPAVWLGIGICYHGITNVGGGIVSTNHFEMSTINQSTPGPHRYKCLGSLSSGLVEPHVGAGQQKWANCAS